MTWIGWILFLLMVIWYVASQNFCQRKRNHLRCYTVSLLLNDLVRNDHKAKFEQWIAQSNARNAMQLSIAAFNVIDNMAEKLAMGAGSSILGAHAELWNLRCRLQISGTE